MRVTRGDFRPPSNKILIARGFGKRKWENEEGTSDADGTTCFDCE